MEQKDVLYRAFQIGSHLRAEMVKGPDLTDTFSKEDIELIGEAADIQFGDVVKLLGYYMAMKMKADWMSKRDARELFEAIAVLREAAECIITLLIAVNLAAITPNLNISDAARKRALKWMRRLRKQTDSVDELYAMTEDQYPWATLSADEWGRSLKTVEEHHGHNWWIKSA